MRLFISRVLPCLVVAGCGSWDPEINSDVEIAPPRLIVEGDLSQNNTATNVAEITIVEPNDATLFKAKETIDCLVQVDVPDGSEPPNALVAELRQDGRPFGSNSLVVEERHPNRYLLRTTLMAPSQPGAYRLRAEAIYSIFRVSKEPGARPTPETKRTYSPEVTVLVEE